MAWFLFSYSIIATTKACKYTSMIKFQILVLGSTENVLVSFQLSRPKRLARRRASPYDSLWRGRQDVGRSHDRAHSTWKWSGYLIFFILLDAYKYPGFYSMELTDTSIKWDVVLMTEHTFWKVNIFLVLNICELKRL